MEEKEREDMLRKISLLSEDEPVKPEMKDWIFAGIASLLISFSVWHIMDSESIKRSDLPDKAETIQKLSSDTICKNSNAYPGYVEFIDD